MARRLVSKRQEEKAESRRRLGALDEVSDAFKAYRPASSVLTSVRAVRTCFVQVDHATRVGGWPIERTCVVHGKSNEGKTSFAIGLAGSFVRAGGYSSFEDAECTTDRDFIELIAGEAAHSPRFLGNRPRTYEACMDRTTKLMRTLKVEREARRKRGLPDISLLTVVDSLGKLMPEDAMAKLMSEKKGAEEVGPDGMGGRLGMILAAMNTAWFRLLAPLLDECGGAFLAIARESQDPNADQWARKFGNDYKVQGGNSVLYEPALRARIDRAGWVTRGEGREAVVLGERHRVTLIKTKVGPKEGRATTAYFHSSNGVLTPPGLDRARDVLELAVKLGVVHLAGSSYSLGEGKARARIASGEHNAVLALSKDWAMLDDVEERTRAAFATHQPESHDEETGEVYDVFEKANG